MIGSRAVTTPLAGTWTSNRIVLPIVNVRLAIRDNQHLVSGQMVVENGLERDGLPAQLAFVSHALVGLKIVDERTQIFGDRLQLRDHGACLSIKAMNPSPRSIDRTPVTHPRQLRWATSTVTEEITAPMMANR